MLNIFIALKETTNCNTKPVVMLNSPGSTTVTLERQKDSGFRWLHRKVCDRLNEMISLSNQHLALIYLICFILSIDKFGILPKNYQIVP